MTSWIEKNNKLQKEFQFKNFLQALDFVNKVIREYVLFYPSLSGIRLQVKGRINGSERSRKEVFQTGNISLQTATNKLNYCCTSAFTIYGTCGLKVWMSFDN